MKKRILKNSKVKNISRFVSLKTDSVQTTESDLEFDACFHFEFAPQIKTVALQQEQIDTKLSASFHINVQLNISNLIRGW
ncbi:hypothetical protein [Vibrio albus]|uniref:hypothetical protein n=1 Tax=Vibrio albus TaxID=2200953 RepID=UPI001FE4AEAD|nr:hypothetical protein [Vibrio albus]